MTHLILYDRISTDLILFELSGTGSECAVKRPSWLWLLQVGTK